MTYARTHYFSQLISAHQHKTTYLFKTVDQLVNQPPSCAPVDSEVAHF